MFSAALFRWKKSLIDCVIRYWVRPAFAVYFFIVNDWKLRMALILHYLWLVIGTTIKQAIRCTKDFKHPVSLTQACINYSLITEKRERFSVMRDYSWFAIWSRLRDSIANQSKGRGLRICRTLQQIFPRRGTRCDEAWWHVNYFLSANTSRKR